MKFNFPRLATLTFLAKNTQESPSVEIYNSSITPKHLPFNTYNYCNAPHINVAHYEPPNNTNVILKYVTIVLRHHKVRQIVSLIVAMSLRTLPQLPLLRSEHLPFSKDPD
jgi:hypothetical protein